MIKIGFELEAFVLDALGTTSLVPKGLPYDECGWLAEIRSEPHTDVGKALHLLQAEREAVEALAQKDGYTLLYEPLREVPRDLKVKAARLHGKGLIQYRNLYGYETHKNATKFQTASLHVSFTNQREFSHDKGKFTYQGFIDHAKIITLFDRAFKAEILAAKRNPGFYEVKSDGRIEYRSLPNNVDFGKLREVMVPLLREL